METQRRPAAEAHASRGRAVEKLKSVVMKCAMGSAPADSRSLRRIRALIDMRIHELLPTPHHPPYAWMIENAVKELNEEGGLDEEAISKFILAEYKDLPWAHPAFLRHHLKRLSKTGNLTHSHDKLSPSPRPSPSPVSSFSPTYASSDSSASIQSFVQERRRKKKIKTNGGEKRRRRQKKRINARGMLNCCDGKQVGGESGDIGLDGMREVDIISLLTEDEDEANLQQQQQQIVVFEHQHGTNIGGKIEAMQQSGGDDHDCSTPTPTPTTFPEKTKGIRNRNSRGSKHRKPRMRRVETMEGDVNGVEQDSMDEQVYGGEPTDVQRKESGEVLYQQNHYCPKPKPRPRPYRNVADIYESSSTATGNTD